MSTAEEMIIPGSWLHRNNLEGELFYHQARAKRYEEALIKILYGCPPTGTMLSAYCRLISEAALYPDGKREDYQI